MAAQNNQRLPYKQELIAYGIEVADQEIWTHVLNQDVAEDFLQIG